jgi:streptogramin lyase
MQGCPPDNTPSTFDYIWIANTSQNTVSKINTMTGVEEGRYLVGPGQTNASRTSVNQFGDVAVSSRHEGRVTKVAALEVRCVDKNNNGMIDTATDANYLPWGEDECVLWDTPIPSPSYTHGPRATAWEAVEQDLETCEMPTPRVWIGYKDGNNAAHFLRLDGDDGAILDDVVVENWSTSFSPYGGAVNSEGDFIITGYNGDRVLHIDSETLEITDLGLPPGQYKYGMGVQGNGDIWVGSFSGPHNLYHYKWAEQQWVGLGQGGGAILGVAVDKEGRVWGAGTGPCRLVEADAATDTYTATNIALPGCGSPWGVSVDNENYIWVVDKQNKAYKVDPNTHNVELVFDKLVNPYTYSDMTGQGLQLVIPQ